MPVHGNACRFDVQLLTDLDQVLATLAAGAGFRLMAALDARQVRRQSLPTSAVALDARRAGHRFKFRILGK
jgi:hypothetical protein